MTDGFKVAFQETLILNPESAKNLKFSTIQPKSLLQAALSSEEHKKRGTSMCQSEL